MEEKAEKEEKKKKKKKRREEKRRCRELRMRASPPVFAVDVC